MTLKTLLLEQIALDGPMPLARYMQACLLHPDHGYYATRDPFGAKGDFVTAPEMTQMFGELLGLCLAQSWMDQGGGPCVLAELGPGRGTLMADILRASGTVPGFAPQVHLVEASEILRDVQRDTLKGVEITWHDNAATLPQSPLYLVANEFFDALPIHQFMRQGRGWAEKQVGAKGDALVLGLSEPVPMEALSHRLADTKDGDVVELRPAADPIIAEISGRIAQHGGAALITDYGDWASLGDTFQALKAHAPCDPLEAPGKADLTAHVDFAALSAASQCAVSKMTTQAELLFHLGIGPRAQKLAEKLDDAGDATALNAHLAAYQRLTEPTQMGTLFKAIALYPQRVATPPLGFDA